MWLQLRLFQTNWFFWVKRWHWRRSGLPLHSNVVSASRAGAELGQEEETAMEMELKKKKTLKESH